MPMIAKIVVDIALDREFDYSVPPELQAAIVPGVRVIVPFGKSRTAGYVVGVSDKSERTDLKSVASLIGDKPFVNEKILQLARWIGEYYCASVEQAIRAVLPAPVRHKNAKFKTQLLVSLCPGAPAAKLSPKQSDERRCSSESTAFGGECDRRAGSRARAERTRANRIGIGQSRADITTQHTAHSSARADAGSGLRTRHGQGVH